MSTGDTNAEELAVCCCILCVVTLVLFIGRLLLAVILQ